MVSDGQANLQEVEGLWFSPDLVVLKAGNRLFRVFTSILKEKSSVFADMFALPQPVSAEVESMGEVPVVLMHDDPADLEAFLRAMFDPSYLMRPESVEFDAFIGILRLSHKYDVNFLRRRALEYLGTLYFTRLEDFDEISSQILNDIKIHPAPNLKAIRAAVEVGALWLLPDAYYALCNTDPEDIVMAGVPWDSLGDAEKRNCLRVFSHNTRMRGATEILAFLAISKDQSSTCDNWVACNGVRSEKLQYFAWTSTNHALDGWRIGDWHDLRDWGLCKSCLDEAHEIYKCGRKKFWDELPGMFALPGWDELEEMRDAALT
ncbi:hypothetical protein FB451DRAFT_1403060 [Mycena latifolia]|nr:hypothetical protein FB451DRAFT_1403060 [Mycena latifolia]